MRVDTSEASTTPNQSDVNLKAQQFWKNHVTNRNYIIEESGRSKKVGTLGEGIKHYLLGFSGHASFSERKKKAEDKQFSFIAPRPLPE